MYPRTYILTDFIFLQVGERMQAMGGAAGGQGGGGGGSFF